MDLLFFLFHLLCLGLVTPQIIRSFIFIFFSYLFIFYYLMISRTVSGVWGHIACMSLESNCWGQAFAKGVGFLVDEERKVRF